MYQYYCGAYSTQAFFILISNNKNTMFLSKIVWFYKKVLFLCYKWVPIHKCEFYIFKISKLLLLQVTC